MFPYILGISRLDSSAILGFRTTILLCSNLYYYPIFPTKTSLSVLGTYANIFFKLYTIHTCRYYIYSTRSSCILLPFRFFLLLRARHPSGSGTCLLLHILSSILFYIVYILYYRLGSREVLGVLALYFRLLIPNPFL